MYSSNIDIKGIISLLVSSNSEDYNLAKSIIEEKKMTIDELEALIDTLNSRSKTVRFFMDSCNIKRIVLKHYFY